MAAGNVTHNTKPSEVGGGGGAFPHLIQPYSKLPALVLRQLIPGYDFYLF